MKLYSNNSCHFCLKSDKRWISCQITKRRNILLCLSAALKLFLSSRSLPFYFCRAAQKSSTALTLALLTTDCTLWSLRNLRLFDCFTRCELLWIENSAKCQTETITPCSVGTMLEAFKIVCSLQGEISTDWQAWTSPIK